MQCKALMSGGYQPFLRVSGREDEIPEWRAEIEPQASPSKADLVSDLLTRAEEASGY